MEKYPEILVTAVNEYLAKYEGSKVFHYDSHASNMYIDKSIVSTNYRVYILYGNLFEVIRYTVCSKQEWNYKEVSSDSMVAWEIQMCYEKGGFFE